jgi:transposase InsO family protein
MPPFGVAGIKLEWWPASNRNGGRDQIGMPGRDASESTECLNAHWFMTLADAREKLEAWRKYYNEERPHGAIGNKVPISLQTPGGAISPSP